MTIEQMRIAIAGVYPTQTWSYRVDCMADNQVIAVYNKFTANGKLDPRKSEKSKKARSEGCFDPCTYEKQLSIYDLQPQTVQDILGIDDFDVVTIFDMTNDCDISAWEKWCFYRIPEPLLNREVKSWKTETGRKYKQLELYI